MMTHSIENPVMNAMKTTTAATSQPADEATMLDAVRRRDADYDGRFWYGVITTGVFCKPSCAARPALAENLRYFGDIASAVASGFRPCKRCRPAGTADVTDALVDVARYIEAHADERLTLATLAARANLSVSRLQRAFKDMFGITPKAYQDGVRMHNFRAALKQGDDITGAIFSAGFGSTSRVYGDAAHNIGMTPTAYRSGGAGETISWARRNTALGPVMMAATDTGVCFVQFGDNEASLLQQLQDEFPRATLSPSSMQRAPELDAWLRALDAYLAGNAPRPDLPLDLRGTAFQLQVWRFLLSVREGDVLSYGELAARIGKPAAARAVAGACAANRIGVLVPCHRVLRGNGDLGGYRWGKERKRALLDAERKAL